MIRKLQRRFILIATVILFLVTAVLITTINVVQIRRSEAQSDELLEYVASGMDRNDFRDGMKPPSDRGFPPEDSSEDENAFPSPPDERGEDFGEPFSDGNAFSPNDPGQRNKEFRSLRITPETEYTTRYFSVSLDENGSVTATSLDRIAAVSEEEAQAYALRVSGTGKTSGYTDGYKYLIQSTDSGSTVWFLDCSEILQTRSYTLWSTVIVGAVFVLVCIVLITLISRRAVRPLIENAERQKQFITDAGHELKTPLAIISANTDVLALTAGENEWLESTRNQLSRMEKLVQDLLTLSRMEETVAPNALDFDLSEAVTDTAEPFRSLAVARGKELRLDIAPGIRYVGDEGQLRRLVSILMDNALKYASPSAPIRLSLKQENKKILLTQSNACDPVPDRATVSHLFDRFYRADPSRSRESGGFGIGLSIAKGIAEAHKGKITAKITDENEISFILTLS